MYSTFVITTATRNDGVHFTEQPCIPAGDLRMKFCMKMLYLLLCMMCVYRKAHLQKRLQHPTFPIIRLFLQGKDV